MDEGGIDIPAGQLAALDGDEVEITDETARWRGRDATFMAGQWAALSKRIPTFAIADFKAFADGPSNPHIRSVVRQPLTKAEQPIPVGVVSRNYRLAQHAEIVEMCFKGLRAHDMDTRTLRCEIGLTPLGEWMNFRAFFPESYSHRPPDGNKLALRLECFNSVDGSSRLVILLGWFRFVCLNGLIVGETKAELRDIHDQHLNLDVIPGIIATAFSKVEADLDRLHSWEKSKIELLMVERWVDLHVAEQWGKKAACRTLHVCRSAKDVELTELFAGGKPSEKQIKLLGDVPGAPKPAKNLFDVSQALSWVATHRNSAEERLKWQGDIPALIENLANLSKAA